MNRKERRALAAEQHAYVDKLPITPKGQAYLERYLRGGFNAPK